MAVAIALLGHSLEHLPKFGLAAVISAPPRGAAAYLVPKIPLCVAGALTEKRYALLVLLFLLLSTSVL